MPERPAIHTARFGIRWQFGMRGLVLLTLVVLASLTHPGISYGQDTPSETASNATLADRQRLLSGNFDELEKLMLKMADIDESNNPQRANLLREAVRNSRNLRVQSRMVETTDSLGDGQLKRASDQQTLIENDLRNLLRLLQSENRDEQLKNEEERIRSYIQSARKLLNRQRSIKGRTSGGADTKPLSEEQARLADDAQSLADEIAEQEEGGRSESTESESAEGKPSDGEAAQDAEKGKSGEDEVGEPQNEPSQGGESPDGDAQPREMKGSQGEGKEGDPKEGKQAGEGQPSDGEMKEGKSSDQPSDGEGKQEDSKAPQPMGEPGEEGAPQDSQNQPSQPQEGEQQDSQPQQGQPQQGQPQQGQPQESQPQEGQPQAQNQQQQQQQQPEFSPRRRIEEAQQRMQEAQKKLEEAKQQEAVEDQEAAQDELAQAIAELEEILRQIREEEIERVLARLEARFTKMLEMQLRVNDDTERLAKIPVDQRGSAEDAEAGKLSFAEKQIVVEADKALELLKEEGSSIAFPESLMQIRDDMQQVADRLGQTKLDDLTITMEEDIIVGLEELLESLKQAQREQEERQNQQQQQQQQQTQPGEEPLVDKIAELRLIKSMQVRVNQRTDRYAQMLDDAEDEVGQATSDDLKALLRDLARRQSRIYDITRDNVQGKNQ